MSNFLPTDVKFNEFGLFRLALPGFPDRIDPDPGSSSSQSSSLISLKEVKIRWKCQHKCFLKLEDLTSFFYLYIFGMRPFGGRSLPCCHLKAAIWFGFSWILYALFLEKQLFFEDNLHLVCFLAKLLDIDQN